MPSEFRLKNLAYANVRRILDWLPEDWCLECAGRHEERLREIVYHSQPIRAEEIRAEFPHLYGPPAGRNDATTRALNRALHKIGAVINHADLTWTLPRARRAKAS
jgi:hypothetical protein